MHYYDVAIIGAGTAGLAALREVRKRTENFVLINSGDYGTTCARVGCMPSKALIESANAFHRRRAFDELGIQGASHLTVDVAAVLRRVRRLRDDFVAGILPLTDSLGPRSVHGRARFLDADLLEVGAQRLRARTTIIATGSRPIVPDDWRSLGTRVLTSDDLFERKSLPQSVGVVGLGSIGVEIAQALARLGIRIMALGRGASVAGLTDPSINGAALRLLAEDFDLHVEREVELQADGEGVRMLAGDISHRVDAVIAALGRRPNVDGLGLERLGVALNEHGVPQFDPHTMQLASLPVFIAGDATAITPVLHEASDSGHIAGLNAPRSEHTRFRRRTALGIVFADPNIAIVGQRFSELDSQAVAIGRVDFTRQGRARLAHENRGLLHVYARKSDGRLLGAEMCAPRGEHLAHLLALAIERRATVHELLRMPFYHPVVEEGLRTALRDLSGQLHIEVASDLASCDAVGADALD